MIGAFTVAVQGEPSSARQGKATIVAYTYSSFASYGAADVVRKAFKKATGANVRFVATGDSRAMLAKFLAERSATGEVPADAFVGVEINDAGIANSKNIFIPLTITDVPNLREVPKSLRFDPTGALIPYEHGYITLVYDTRYMKPGDAPVTFQDLLKHKYRRSLIVEDPRTSSPGLSFLLWTIARFGNSGYLSYWRELLPNILTITSSWDMAFNLLSQGEAPIMVSFSTDRAYDVIANKSDTLRVQLLDGEGYETIFGMGVVRGTRHPKLARALLNVILSPEVQSQLPETEWMMPANTTAHEPKLFEKYAVVPSSPVLIPVSRVESSLSRWITDWTNDVLTR
jgi:thiamine transport system substrate-binding protein